MKRISPLQMMASIKKRPAKRLAEGGSDFTLDPEDYQYLTGFNDAPELSLDLIGDIMSGITTPEAMALNIPSDFYMDIGGTTDQPMFINLGDTSSTIPVAYIPQSLDQITVTGAPTIPTVSASSEGLSSGEWNMIDGKLVPAGVPLGAPTAAAETPSPTQLVAAASPEKGQSSLWDDAKKLLGISGKEDSVTIPEGWKVTSMGSGKASITNGKETKIIDISSPRETNWPALLASLGVAAYGYKDASKANKAASATAAANKPLIDAQNAFTAQMQANELAAYRAALARMGVAAPTVGTPTAHAGLNIPNSVSYGAASAPATSGLAAVSSAGRYPQPVSVAANRPGTYGARS